MPDFELTIAGSAPALNRTYKVVYVDGKPRLAKTSEVAVWQDQVAWLVKSVRPKGWEAARRVMIEIEWYSKGKRDCDAGVKATLDAIATGLGVDDSCFLLHVPVNEIDKSSPRTVIRVTNQ